MAYTRVSGARSGGSGGGLLLRATDWESPAPRFYATHSVFSGNHAQDGGGIALLDGAVATLDSTVIAGNSAFGYGGGVHCDSPFILVGKPATEGQECRITLEGCEILDNSASRGGGIGAFVAHVGLAGSSIQGNEARIGGGLYLAYSGALIVRTSMLHNRATVMGGAVSGLSGSIDIVQSVVAGNEAPNVGGINGASIDMERCTVTDNDGGGLGIGSGKVAELSNSVVWGNSPNDVNVVTVPGVGGGRLTARYSAIGGDTSVAGDGNLNADPLFRDPANGDYRLRRESPCIDTGDPASPLDPDSSRADMGAFPYDKSSPVAALPPPVGFSLAQNTPNPFNPRTTLRFTLPAAGRARLAVYSVAGQLVRVLADGPMDAGRHGLVWDGLDDAGRSVASGVYLCRLTVADAGARSSANGNHSPTNASFASVRRMLLLR